jgi:hypothetical protein
MPPQITLIDGIQVNIYAREHIPAHFHASHGDDEALIDIKTGEVLKGYLPKPKLKKIKDWLNTANNKATLEEIFFKLNPGLRKK